MTGEVRDVRVPAAPERSASLGRAAAVMAAGTLLSRVTGLGRNVALALFGFAALSDAYLLANNSPNIVFELVLGGVLSATLVPIFVELVRREGRGSPEGIDAIFTLTLVVSATLALVLSVGAPWMIRLYTWGQQGAGVEQKREVATLLLRMFGPQVAVYGFITVATALLNARRRFAAPMLAPVLNNAVVIATLLATRWYLHRVAAGSDGLEGVRRHTGAQLLLGLGTTAGVIAMGAALLPSLRASGPLPRWHWNPRHPAVRSVARLSGWTLGYVVANQVALYFVVATANRGADGDYTAYAAAYSTFFVLPHGIFAVSIMTALQPQLSHDYLERRRGRFRRHLREGICRTAAVMIPAAAGYVVLGRPLVALVLQRGGMTERSAQLTGDVLAVMAVGLPAFSVYLLLMNACKAMRDTRVTFTVNAWENALNIAFAALFYRRYGVQGLALAFALAYVVAAVMAGVAVSRRLGGIGGAVIADRVGRMILATALMAGAVWAISRGVRGALPDLPVTVARTAEVGAAVAGGVTVYAVIGRLIGVVELAVVFAGLRRRFRPARTGAPRPPVRRTDSSMRRTDTPIRQPKPTSRTVLKPPMAESRSPSNAEGPL